MWQRASAATKFCQQLSSWLEGCQEMLVEGESVKHFAPSSRGNEDGAEESYYRKGSEAKPQLG